MQRQSTSTLAMKKHIYLILVSIFFIFGASAQTIKRPDGKVLDAKAVDRIVLKLMDTADVAGMQVGIINDGKPVFVRAYGYKNKAKNQMNDTSTVFYAASLAKSLFAYIVMQLVDEGKIDLDKPLYQYLPKPLPGYDDYKDLATDDRYKLITARVCLDHTTGFPNFRWFNPHDNNKLEIFFTPGTRYAYSGEGINLLQFVVEKVTGQTLDVMARERVFKPLGMTHTDYTWQPRFEQNYALGHDMNGDTLKKHKRFKAIAAGSMETTAGDYTKFMAAVIQGKGLSQKSWKEMLKPQIAINSKRQFPTLVDDTTSDNRKIHLSYGIGWGLFDTPYGQAFFKEGHDDGWVHYCIGIPGKKFALILMSNSSNGESIYKELVEKLGGFPIPWFWENYTPYRENSKLPVAYLSQLTGEYNGKLKAIITLKGDRLQVESPTTNMPKTNMYAVNDHHFYLKTMDVDVDFTKDDSGKITKLIVNDEGEHYELTKNN